MRKIRKKSISLHKIQPKHPFFDVRDNHIHHRVGRRDWCPGVGPYGPDRYSRHPAYAQQGPTARTPHRTGRFTLRFLLRRRHRLLPGPGGRLARPV